MKTTHGIGQNDFWMTTLKVGDGDPKVSFVSNLDGILQAARQMSTNCEVSLMGRNDDTGQVMSASFRCGKLLDICVENTEDFINA